MIDGRNIHLDAGRAGHVQGKRTLYPAGLACTSLISSTDNRIAQAPPQLPQAHSRHTYQHRHRYQHRHSCPCCTVLYSAVYWCTVLYSVVQWCMMLKNVAQCCTLLPCVLTVVQCCMHSVVQCCIVLYSIAHVQHCAALYSVVRCCTVLHNVVKSCTALYNAVKSCIVLYSVVQYCTLLYIAVQCCTALHNIAQGGQRGGGVR